MSPDSKDAFTVLLCTNAAGHIYLILVIFNGTTQLEDPLVYVEGVPFLVIFNDTHWNNTFAYRAFLQVLVQFLPSCCDSKKCSSHLLISDRFSGHDSPETAALLEEHRICPIVVEDTTRGAPNDFCFNHLIRTTFDNTQLQIHQDRAKANAFRERDGLPPHPFDPQGHVPTKLRHQIQRFYKHTAVSIALNGEDKEDARVSLQDGSLLQPPL